MKKNVARILLGLVVVIMLVVVLGIFFLGKIVEAGVEKVGPRVAKVPVKIDGATISVLGGSGTIKGFVLGNPEGFKSPEAIKVGEIELVLVPTSVLKDKVVIRQIRVVGPEVTYEPTLKGSNLSRILENVSSSAEQDEKAPTKDEQATKTKLQVDDVRITGAKLHVASMLGGATLPLPEIHLANLGQGPDGITPAELGERVLAAIVDAATKVVAQNAGKLGETGKALGSGAVDQLKKAGGGVGDLFKKKE
jgi:hypothetical protein